MHADVSDLPAGLALEGADPPTLEATRAFNAELERMLAREPGIDELGPAETRRRRRAGESTFPPAPVFVPQAREETIAGRSGPIRLRVIAPERPPVGIFLYLHGGGWTIGGADLQDPLLAELAAETGLCAVSVDFRLAPEHAYPAAVNDCEDAALWLLERGPGALGAPPRFAIGGESSGAHLAVLTLLRLRDAAAAAATSANAFAFTGATLAYGLYDLSLRPSRRLRDKRELIISAPILRAFVDWFLPGTDLESRRRPEISPLYSRLDGLPPALFTVGTLDPLLDDTLAMHARWLAAGNRATLRVWREAPHLFMAFPTLAGRAARAQQYEFLRSLVGAGAG